MKVLELFTDGCTAAQIACIKGVAVADVFQRIGNEVDRQTRELGGRFR